MGAPATPTKSGKRKRKRQSANGHRRPANANGNGARARSNGTGLHPPDPLARDLVAAVISNGAAAQGEARISKPQARKIAVEFGGAMLEATNLETAQHSDDVVIIAKALCEMLGIKGTERQDLLAAARLHDIGKAAIPAEILNKPGPLDDSEWELMRQHTVIGDQILSSVTQLQGIAYMVRHSHERWDGKGYPDGLKGEDIPLGSRVIFCADAFHAIRADRPYRAGRTAAQSLAEIKRNSGTQFDPSVVEAFEQVVRDLKLAPARSPIKRSSRLTAMLLMLAIGSSGSAVAASGILGEPQAPGEPASGFTGSSAGGQMLGLSFDDAIKVQRSGGAFDPYALDASRIALATGGAGAAGAQIGTPAEGARPGAELPAASDQAQRPSETNSTSSGDGSSSGSTPGNSGNNPHGGPPGQTGQHPHGGPPGQTGQHPHGGPPGQTGQHPQGGPPGQSNKGSSGSSGSSGVSGNSGGNGNGPSGNGPPGQSKKPK